METINYYVAQIKQPSDMRDTITDIGYFSSKTIAQKVAEDEAKEKSKYYPTSGQVELRALEIHETIESFKARNQEILNEKRRLEALDRISSKLKKGDTTFTPEEKEALKILIY